MEDLRLVEGLVRAATLSLACGGEIAPDGLLDDEARPAGALRESGASERFDRRNEALGRERQVERPVRVDVGRGFELPKPLLEDSRIVDVAARHAMPEHALVAPRGQDVGGETCRGDPLAYLRSERRVVDLAAAPHAHDETAVV